MRAVLLVARTEVLEHRRQPWMVFVLVLNYVLWLVAFGIMFGALSLVNSQPAVMAQLEAQFASVGVELDAMLYLGVSSFGALMFTNMPLFVALMSSYSVLHDRTCGTMPFLMLSPLSRWQLLAGKLLGAMAIPLVLHLLFVGAGSLAMGRLDLLAEHSIRLGGSAAWWVAFLLGGPASAVLVGALGTVISALSRDVRTSMQYTSFFFGLLSLGMGAALVDGISEGVVVQLIYAVGCLGVGLVALTIGARLISRDVPPT
jgi:ABC-type transport system involved in multi-copper enzyme maturation permease subunit